VNRKNLKPEYHLKKSQIVRNLKKLKQSWGVVAMTREELFNEYITKLNEASNSEDPNDMALINAEYDQKLYDYDKSAAGKFIEEFGQKDASDVSSEEMDDYQQQVKLYNEKYGNNLKEHKELEKARRIARINAIKNASNKNE